MSLSGFHVLCGYVGGRSDIKTRHQKDYHSLMRDAHWSQTMPSPGLSSFTVPQASMFGDAVIEMRTSQNVFVSIGAAPDANAGPRIYMAAGEGRNMFASPGDRVAWAVGTLTGLHVACGFVGGKGAGHDTKVERHHTLFRNVQWSQTFTSAGTTTSSAPASLGQGDVCFEVRAAVDGYAAFGHTPDAINGPRLFIGAGETRNVFAMAGDRLAWSLA